MLTTILLLLLAQPVTRVDDVPNPRWYGNWVTDQAEIIETTARARVNSRIDHLNEQIGIEIAVVTVDRVMGVPRDFAVDLFNHWGIGAAVTNNGLLIFLAVGQRRLEIVTGTGLETVLTDAWLRQMQEAEMVPLFRSGMFGSGLEAGLEAIEGRLLEAPAEAASTATGSMKPPAGISMPPQAPDQPPEEAAPFALAEPFPSGWVLWTLGAGLLAGGAWLGKRKYQAFRRECRTCGVPMILLDEVADDQHLDSGQRKEEELGSRDYDVYICGECQETRIMPHRKWFSGYRRCPECGYKTNKRTSTTSVRATAHRGGEVVIRERCSHCSHHSSETRYTAPRSDFQRSSFGRGSSLLSSSGRARGSFGGGRSRGGGSGASW